MSTTKNTKIQAIREIVKKIDTTKVDTAIQDSIKYVKGVEKIIGVSGTFTDLILITAIQKISKISSVYDDEYIAQYLLQTVEDYCFKTIKDIKYEL